MSFLKILVIGDVGTGKTSLVNRIVYNSFSEKYKATVGCEFGMKIMEIQGEPVRVQLWDLAGQDRLGGVSRLYCRDANGALVVSDITREDTIEKAALWKNSIDDNVRQMDGSSIPMVLCLNKSDAVSPGQMMSNQDLQRYCQRNEFVEGFFTSAKSGDNANEALNKLVNEIMKEPPKSDHKESQIMANAGAKLNTSHSRQRKSSCCVVF